MRSRSRRTRTGTTVRENDETVYQEGIEKLCRNGWISDSGRCASGLKSRNKGKECTTDADCPTNDSEVNARCVCGNSDTGIKRCDIQGGDTEWQDAITKVGGSLTFSVLQLFRSNTELPPRRGLGSVRGGRSVEAVEVCGDECAVLRGAAGQPRLFHLDVEGHEAAVHDGAGGRRTTERSVMGGGRGRSGLCNEWLNIS